MRTFRWYKRLRRAMTFSLLGAAWTYFFDPQQGAARRRRVTTWSRELSAGKFARQGATSTNAAGGTNMAAASGNHAMVPGPAEMPSKGSGPAMVEL